MTILENRKAQLQSKYTKFFNTNYQIKVIK